MPNIRTQLVSAALCTASALAQAAPFKIEFTATSFYDLNGRFAFVVQKSVSGSFIVEVDRSTDRITDVLDVDLTIAGHTYTLSEVSVQSSWGEMGLIGGSLRGVDAILPGTNDFWLGSDSRYPIGGLFAYTSTSDLAANSAQRLSIRMTEVAAPVPEPSTAFLALAGVGAGLFARRSAIKPRQRLAGRGQ